MLRVCCAAAAPARAPPPRRRSCSRALTRRVTTTMAAPQPNPAAQTQDAAPFVDTLRREVVVVGGGVAAGNIAREFAAAGQGSRLAIISDDASLPYERPALSKKYLHEKSPARLPGFLTCVGGGGEAQDAGWYARHGVKVLHGGGAHVTVADVASRRLATACGRVVAYDRLVVATGAAAARLPAAAGGELRGVHYLRSEADAAGLVAAAKRGARVVIVGGGFIGMEVAAGLAPRGCQVTLVFPEDHLMPRLFTKELASHYEALYKDRGIDIRPGESVARLVADEAADADAVAGVELRSGSTLPCDLVVVGIGARPVVRPFEALAQADAPPGGIKVDAQLRASGPGVPHDSVFAVGDAAVFPLLQHGGRLTRVEHVDHARQSAAHVAKMLLRGEGAPYDYTPFYYSRVFEEEGSPRPARWVFYGDSRGEAIVVGDFKPQLLCVWLSREGDDDDGGGGAASTATGEGGEHATLRGVLLESGAPDVVAQLPALARAARRVDAAALRRCGDVRAALALLGVRA